MLIPCLLIFSADAAEGASQSLILCFDTLIPSLFAFMTVSEAVIRLICEKTPRFTPVSRLLKTDGSAEAAILLSFIGGYPVGIRCISSLYQSGKLTLGDARRLSLTLVNPAPSFVISAIGIKMLGSAKAGVIICASVYLSNIIVSLILVFFKDLYGFSRNDRNTPESPSAYGSGFSKTLVSSVSSSSVAMLYICMFTVFFGAVSAVFCSAVKGPVADCVIKCVLEVTLGCKALVQNGYYLLPLLSAVICFGGVCVMLQVLCFGNELKIAPVHYIFVRILSAALSAVIAKFLCVFYTPEISVISNTAQPLKIAGNYGFFTTLLLVAAIIVFLLTLNKSSRKSGRCRNFTFK